MRLTKKDLDMLDTTSVYSKAQHKAVCEQAIKECYEYKCIEEDLGIDLITLFKAMTSGFYYKGISNHGIEFIGFAIMRRINKMYMVVSNKRYYFKDYGKTWALTKEELE